MEPTYRIARAYRAHCKRSKMMNEIHDKLLDAITLIHIHGLINDDDKARLMEDNTSKYYVDETTPLCAHCFALLCKNCNEVNEASATKCCECDHRMFEFIKLSIDLQHGIFVIPHTQLEFKQWLDKEFDRHYD